MVDCQNLKKWICSSSAKNMLTILIQLQFERAGSFLYFMSESKDEDGKDAVCLEVIELGSDGEWLNEMYFTGFGEDAHHLCAFYEHFLTARDGQHMKVAAMICSGFTDREDIQAGLKVQDFDRLVADIEAAKTQGYSLRFFAH